MSDRQPQYDGVGIMQIRDHGRDGDRYLVVFQDGTALAVSHDGLRSAWQDDHFDIDPWVLGRYVAYDDLPSPVRSEVLARADELHKILSERS